MRPHHALISRGQRHRLLALLVFLALALLLSTAMAQSPDTFEVDELKGYFETAVWLYEQPGRSSNTLVKIPQYTPLQISLSTDPAHKGYGQTEYEGMAGYVRMNDFFKMPAEQVDARAGKTMFARDVRVFREESLHNAGILKRLPPETPFLVLARTKFMIKVDVDGQIGYIYGNDLQELTPDLDLEPFMMYSREEQELLSWPLSGSKALERLKAGQLISVTGQNRGYLRVKTAAFTGFVKKESLGKIGAIADETMLIYADTPLPLYAGADAALITDTVMAPATLYEVTAQAGDFLQIKEFGLFVQADLVNALILKPFKTARLASVEGDVPLSPMPDAEPDSAQVLTPERLYTFTAASGSWWYVDDGVVKGFVNSRQLISLPTAGERMNRTWAQYLGQDAFLPGSSQPISVQQGEVVILAKLWGGLWFQTADGAYVHRNQVRIIGSDAPVTRHTVNATAGLVMLFLPDEELGQPLLTLEEGTPLEVIGFSRTYLLVRAQGLEGYVKGRGLTTYETRHLPDEDPPAYEILVNKSNLMVSVYRLDENGQRVGEPIRSQIAALGKRSTPTPSGRYVLGFKQRWVRFTHTQAPHGITYLRGRYLHGIPCYGQDERLISEWGRPELGTFATGGCVRMEFDFASFIYFNCPSYTTVMEVVNGI